MINTPEAKKRRRELDKIRYDKNRDKFLAQKKEHYDRTYVRTNRDWREIIKIVQQNLINLNLKESASRHLEQCTIDFFH